jgi:hypothetical protein
MTIKLDNMSKHLNVHNHDDRHDLGLSYDLAQLVREQDSSPTSSLIAIPTLVQQRQVLKLTPVGGIAGAATLGFRRSTDA